MADKNSPFSSAGSSHSAHNEATADMRGRSCSQITADTARRHRSRSPSLDPRYPTLRRDWYAARKEKWYAEDMAWWDAQIAGMEEGQGRRQQQQTTTAAESASSSSSASASALATPRPTLYDEAWTHSADAAMVASSWSTEFAAVTHHDPQRQRERGQEQEQPDEKGSRPQSSEAGGEVEGQKEREDVAGEEGEDVEQGKEEQKKGEDVGQGKAEENERRKGKKRDAKL